VPPSTTSGSQRRTGFSIHILTASGAVTGFLALQSVIDNNIRAALLWLIACLILDSIDGPIARHFDVGIHAPHVDGHVLDLVIDYVTCVVVPVVLLINLQIVPPRLATMIAALILITSALWFARTDQETEDIWFNGFPAMWNIVIPSFLLLGTSKNIAAIVCVFFCFAQLTTVKFPHIVRVKAMHKSTYTAATIYFGAFSLLSANYPHDNSVLRYILLVGPVYLSFIVIWRTWFPTKKILRLSII